MDKLTAGRLAKVRAKIERLERLDAEPDRLVTACVHGKIADSGILPSGGSHDQCLTDHHSATLCQPRIEGGCCLA